MEEVTFSRDTRVIIIPDGIEMVIPEGTRGWVTQVLGGNYTVRLDAGYLVRVAGADAEAIGREPPPPMPEVAPESVDDESLTALVWDQLRTCYDPEIPVNIVELGLVYDCQIQRLEGGGRRVEIQMTLTAPGCGMGEVLKDDIEAKLAMLPGVDQAAVELVFEPSWSPERMSEAARLELGML